MENNINALMEEARKIDSETTPILDTIREIDDLLSKMKSQIKNTEVYNNMEKTLLNGQTRSMESQLFHLKESIQYNRNYKHQELSNEIIKKQMEGK